VVQGFGPDKLATIWQQHWPCQPNAAAMETTVKVITSPCKIPDFSVKSMSTRCQQDGRRAGLKIRRSPEVGSLFRDHLPDLINCQDGSEFVAMSSNLRSM
jgi:hypothetical protein